MSLNKVILIGNVGRDPEVRHLESNTSVARFSLATSEKYRSKAGELQEQTEWHNIVCWRNLAEIAEKYIKKGTKLYIEGKIRTNSWIDKTTQEKKYAIEIYADNIIMLDRVSDERRPKPDSTSGNLNNDSLDSSDIDDLPF